jgi:hypothetical protein
MTHVFGGLLFGFAAALATGCGVEAGNPGDKPKTGTVLVTFARGQEGVASSFKLALESVELRTADDAVAAPLTLTAESIELVDSDGGDVEAASGDAVPVGEYARMVVALKEDTPFTYKDLDGGERTVGFEGDESRAFYVEDDVIVTEGEITELVVDLDTRRSLVHPDDAPDRLVFRPHGAMGRHRGLGYVGKKTVTGGTVVCAYLYAMLPPPPHGEPPEGMSGPGGRPPPPPPPGPGMLSGKVFATKDDVVKDETPECDNAFRIAPVDESGNWRFDHLLPATYDFRAFLGDGTFTDVEEGITLMPPPPPPRPDGPGGEGAGSPGLRR